MHRKRSRLREMYQKHSAEKYRELRAGLEVFEQMCRSSILNRDEANSFLSAALALRQSGLNSSRSDLIHMFILPQ